MITVSADGAIVGGHHGARAAADAGKLIYVLVIEANVTPGPVITELPVLYH
jgi:hypothetical protein